MKKTFKKIAASVMAVATLVMSLTIVSVNAANVAGLEGTAFNFKMGRGLKNTKNLTKSNDLSYAMIDIHQSNLSSTATMNFCMKNSSGTAISPSKTRTNNVYFELTYYSTPANKSTVTLQGLAGYYEVYANGGVIA